MTDIQFKELKEEHLSLWEQWIQLPHVKNTWFVDGYESSDYIIEKIKGNGYDHPYIIDIDNKPMGYIQACDLFAYTTLCKNPKGLFKVAEKDTWCMDLFIADPEFLDKGYGTLIVRKFVQKLFAECHAKTIFIDPAKDNLRAIRCYEKAGFVFVKEAHDGVTDCIVMKNSRD